MPIYEYRCSECDRIFEVMQKLSDAPLTVCVSCSGKLTKVISPSGLVFKGSGFYINDYAGKGKEAPKATDKPTEKKSEEKEAKPAKTEEAASSEKDKKTGKGSTTPVSD